MQDLTYFKVSIYGGKTTQSLPRFQFPSGFSLSVNEKHYSNSNESIKFLKEIIIPYVKKERELKGLDVEQKALVIMDVFTGQMISDVIEVLQENNILVTNVPANMTRFYQPLDLTVNGSAKRFLAKKFNGWYSQQISDELESGKSLEEIDAKLRLSTLKPLHAGWIVDLCNYIINGWKTAGIHDALQLGSSNLPNIDPFHDIDPLVEDGVPIETNLEAVCQLEKELLDCFVTRQEEDDISEDEDDVWEPDDGNVFDILDDFDDEPSL